MSSYARKLRDPRWQKKRLEILEAAGWKCEDCGRSDLELQVHHCAYFRGLDPWQYREDLLMAVCKPCHEVRQEREDGLRMELGRLTRKMDPEVLLSSVWDMCAAAAGLKKA